MNSFKILLIEDDELVRESISDLLLVNGYDIITAVNGKEGYEYITSEKPGLVICDIMMPVMNGFEVLMKLKQDQLLSDIYFMFLSAKSRESDLEKGKELGAHDYLIKPFRNEDLLAKIREVMEKY